jgi:leader peptidase (prepilin peptidase)/N-methyltransferase
MLDERLLIGIFAAVTGAVFGSFSNVVIYRIPRYKSIFTPSRSFCPNCESLIAWYDNIPILSFLLLGGKCRKCNAPISPRYLVVEGAVAALWALIALRFGLVAELPAFLAMSTALVILSAIDFEHRRLPNKVLGPAAVIAVVLLLLAAGLSGEWSRLVRGVIGALAYGLPLFLIAVVVPKGMGGGDIKLGAYLGLHLGWIGLGHVAVGAILGFFTGSIAGVALMAAGKKGRKDPIPFGPFMALGALLAIFIGDRIVSIWLGYS